MMPFEGGLASTGNGTLLLALAAALIHAIGAAEASPLRRMAAAAAPAALMAMLCATLPGPALFLIALAAAAAGEVLLSVDQPKVRSTARAAFGFALVFALILLGQAATGGFVPALRLGAAAIAWLALLAGTLPAFLDAVQARLGPATGRAAVALRHAGVIALGVAVLS